MAGNCSSPDLFALLIIPVQNIPDCPRGLGASGAARDFGIRHRPARRNSDNDFDDFFGKTIPISAHWKIFPASILSQAAKWRKRAKRTRWSF
jgi:hypothetical protein